MNTKKVIKKNKVFISTFKVGDKVLDVRNGRKIKGKVTFVDKNSEYFAYDFVSKDLNKKFHRTVHSKFDKIKLIKRIK